MSSLYSIHTGRAQSGLSYSVYRLLILRSAFQFKLETSQIFRYDFSKVVSKLSFKFFIFFWKFTTKKNDLSIALMHCRTNFCNVIKIKMKWAETKQVLLCYSGISFLKWANFASMITL